MKFSLLSVHGGVKNIDEVHRRAQRAEELGYDGIFLGESHLSSIDSFQTLATCAMLTRRMLLGIAITNMVFHDPYGTCGCGGLAQRNFQGASDPGTGNRRRSGLLPGPQSDAAERI